MRLGGRALAAKPYLSMTMPPPFLVLRRGGDTTAHPVAAWTRADVGPAQRPVGDVAVDPGVAPRQVGHQVGERPALAAAVVGDVLHAEHHPAVTLVGTPVTRITPLVLNQGNTTIAFASITYAGQLTISVVADPACGPDPVDVGDRLRERLLQLVPADVPRPSPEVDT